MTNDNPPAEGASFWTSRGFIWAAVFIAVVVVAAIIVAVTSAPGGTPTSKPSGVATATEPDTSDSECGLPAGDQSIPTAAGPETEWVLVNRIATPTAPNTIGPGIEKDGIRSCFAHSPSGALFATVNFYALGSSSETAKGNLEQNVADGAGKDIARENQSDNLPSEVPETSIQVAGFQVLDYQDERATIDLVVESEGAYVSFVTDMVWVDGDWKFAVQDNGQPAVGPRQVPDLSGYVKWSGA